MATSCISAIVTLAADEARRQMARRRRLAGYVQRQDQRIFPVDDDRQDHAAAGCRLIEAFLKQDGVEDARIRSSRPGIPTSRRLSTPRSASTWSLRDRFPNGRPALEKGGRDVRGPVQTVEQGGADEGLRPALNPVHTGTGGVRLPARLHAKICAEMRIRS